MKEIETKIINIDVDDIRLKLNKLNCIKVKEENQINEIYDFPDRKLLSDKGYARIRTVEDNLKNEKHYYLTVKKMLSQEKYKIMEENEVEVFDASECQKVLTALGLKLIESIKKYRESYKYKNTLIEIDVNDKNFCPFPYIEIESNNEDEIKEIVELLGYTMEDTTSKTMYEILKDERIPKGL